MTWTFRLRFLLHRTLALVAVGTVVAACAPAAQPGASGLDVRAFSLPPLADQVRYLVAVYDIETDPTRVDVTLLPARERDARLFTDLAAASATW